MNIIRTYNLPGIWSTYSKAKAKKIPQSFGVDVMESQQQERIQTYKVTQ